MLPFFHCMRSVIFWGDDQLKITPIGFHVLLVRSFALTFTHALAHSFA